MLQRSVKAIASFNGRINAVIAQTTEAQRAEPTPEGPLENVPFLVKDVIDCRGFRTIAGLPERVDVAEATEDAAVVEAVRKAGGILLGKTNTPVGGLDVQTSNAVFGTTVSPFNDQLTPGGSSGGSAAAVAMGMAPLALGSDLAGSLRIPAAFCGVYSLRPTAGVLPSTGHVPRLASSYTTMGPIASDLDTLRRFMTAFSLPSLPKDQPKFLKIFVSTHLPGALVDDRIRTAITDWAEGLANNDRVEIVSDFSGPSLPLKALAKAHGVLARTAFEPSNNDTPACTAEELASARRVQQEAASVMDSFLSPTDADNGNDLDETLHLWALPVTGVLPFPHNPSNGPVAMQVNGQEHELPYWRVMLEHVTPFSVTGSPVVTAPLPNVTAPSSYGPLPVAVQLVGCRFSDFRMLNAIIAHQIVKKEKLN